MIADCVLIYSTKAMSFLLYEAATSVSSYVYLSQIAMQWFDVSAVHIVEAFLMLYFCARYAHSSYTWLHDLIM
jgi:hypothetical protein